MSRFVPILLLLLVLGFLPSNTGCLNRLKTRPLTPSIIISREMCREAIAAMEQNSWDDAEKKLSKAVRLNPKEPEIRGHFGEVLWQLGKYEDAVYQLKEARELSRKEGAEEAVFSISLGEKYLILNRLPDANEAALRAVAIQPRESRSWALLAKIQALMGAEEMRVNGYDAAFPHYRQAVADYYRALSLLSPYSEQTRDWLRELAEIQLRIQQPQRALATWQHLERLYQPGPQPFYVLRGKAHALTALNRFDDALLTYEAAIALIPDDLDVLLPYARLQVQAGQIGGAMTTLQRIRSIDPNNPGIEGLAQQIESLKHSVRERM
ncbi:MAG: tetratricopeptide repeat protein [Thermoguttaceae bacterium]